MTKIFSTEFDKNSLEEIKTYKYGKNWPIVYILHGKSEAYVGETISAYRRTKNHLDDKNRKKLNIINIISDEDFNKSVALDLESKLIEYIAADGKYKLQNGNKGLREHNYYQKDIYEDKFEIIWNELRSMKFADNKIVDIKNSDLFKLSPFKVLTDEQIDIVESIEKDLINKNTSKHIIHGEPGSGKTILAVYLAKYILENSNNDIKNIGVVVPMKSLRDTVKKVFKKVKGLKTSMVIGPYDVAKKKYDLLIVDEAHRLAKRKMLSNYAAYDKVCESLKLDKHSTNQLDWIIMKSKHTVLFYDKNQTVKPTDIDPSIISSVDANQYTLSSQFRVKAGNQYTKYIEDILKQNNTKKIDFVEYDLRLYSDVNEMIEDIKEKDIEIGLSRNVAGYAWKWESKGNPNEYDISINEYKYRWNSINNDWINSDNAINEIGCIHTVQGYDLNYTGVIIGRDLVMEKGKIKYISENYKDRSAKDLSLSEDEMKNYIINIYKTLLTRGILGTYIYVVDEELREHFKRFISST